ncbi:hypothetical protein LCGC14_3062010, partial [marine sediment metagenome]
DFAYWKPKYKQTEAELAGAKEDSERLVGHIDEVLKGFDVGVFVRGLAHDGEQGWAMRLIKPVGALANLAVYRDAARKESSDA